MADVGVAATQMTCSWDRAENLNRAEKLVRQAASAGASIILIQELFETPYSRLSNAINIVPWHAL